METPFTANLDAMLEILWRELEMNYSSTSAGQMRVTSPGRRQTTGMLARGYILLNVRRPMADSEEPRPIVRFKTLQLYLWRLRTWGQIAEKAVNHPRGND